MATIVQPYNDWREKALVGFLGPIVGNWIQRSQEAEMNRKQNAMAAEALRQLGLGGNDYPVSNPSLAAANVGSNNWENAFRSGSDNPLVQFDANTATIAPTATQASSAPARSMPSLADIQATLINLGGTKRFGMVNPEAVQKLIAPYLNAYEANRVEQNKSSLADTLKAAKNADDRLNELWGGYARGYIPIEGVNAGQAQRAWENPDLIPQMYNAGSSTYGYSFNPRTGEFNFDGGVQFNNSLTPQDAANNAFRDKQLDTQNAQYYAGLESQERINNANIEERRHEHDSTMEYNRETRDWEHNNPTLTSFEGRDGTLYLINPRTGIVTEAKTPDGKTVKIKGKNSYAPYITQDANGNFIIIDPNTRTATPVIAENGSQQQGQKRSQSTAKDLTESQKLQFNANQKEIQELRKQRADYQKRIATFASEPNDPIYIDAQQNLDRIDARIAELDAENKSILGSTTQQPQNSSTRTGLTPFPQYDTPTPASTDIVPASPDVSSSDLANTSPTTTAAPRKKGDKISVNVPDDLWYNPERDRDITPDKLMTLDQFKAWIGQLLGDENLKHLSPEQIMQLAAQQGFRIKRDNEQASLPPEVTGTTFMGEYLPGLQDNGELAASLTPMGLSANENSVTPIREGTPMETWNTSDYLPPVGQSDTQNSKATRSIPPVDMNNSLFPPEVTGTTVGGEELPGLKIPYYFYIKPNTNLPPMPPYNPNPDIPNPSNVSAENNPGEQVKPAPTQRPATRRPQANPPQRTAAPQRTARKPGQIIPNTSYEQLRNEVDSSARRHGVDPELVRAIIQIESRWDSYAISTAGAMGLMQLMPKTAQWLGVRDSYNPAQNIEGGTKYIAQLIRQYKGDINKALMAYNCGPGNVNKGRIPASTKQYARNVMAIYNRLKSQRRR